MTRVAVTLTALALAVTVAGCSRAGHTVAQTTTHSSGATTTIAPVVATGTRVSAPKQLSATPPRPLPTSTTATSTTPTSAYLSGVLADLNSAGAAASGAGSDAAAGDAAAASGDQP